MLGKILRSAFSIFSWNSDAAKKGASFSMKLIISIFIAGGIHVYLFPDKPEEYAMGAAIALVFFPRLLWGGLTTGANFLTSLSNVFKK